jgi:hypothetical protein
MNKIFSLYHIIPLKYRRILRLYFNVVSNLSYLYRPEDGLGILKAKINFYFYFHYKLKQVYLKEIKFINEMSSTDFSYSYVFPYDFIDKYSYTNIKVFLDIDKELFYVMHGLKRLYFKRSIKTEYEVQIAYFCLLIEQDEQSPHRYLDNDFTIDQNSIVLDVGAAEGILGLENIEKISKLYIFEVNDEWIEALTATFEPWKEKVFVVNKYVSDNDDNGNITLDHFFGEDKIDFIKIDVEGAEMSIFKGSTQILSRDSIKIAVCTYHRQEDAEKIEKIFQKNSFICQFADNFMLFVFEDLRPPYFRRGLLRAIKQNVQ